jgi:hypothetical protein
VAQVVLSAAQIQQRLSQLDLLLQGQVDDGVRLAEETLVNDPYNPTLHRALVRVHAARGEAEPHMDAVALRREAEPMLELAHGLARSADFR